MRGYPASRVVRQRLAREKRHKAEHRRQQLIVLLGRTDEERNNLSALSLGELICVKNTQPTLFDQPTKEEPTKEDA